MALMYLFWVFPSSLCKLERGGGGGGRTWGRVSQATMFCDVTRWLGEVELCSYSESPWPVARNTTAYMRKRKTTDISRETTHRKKNPTYTILDLLQGEGK